jgi:hypothetical protein
VLNRRVPKRCSTEVGCPALLAINGPGRKGLPWTRVLVKLVSVRDEEKKFFRQKAGVIVLDKPFHPGPILSSDASQGKHLIVVTL